MQEIILNKKFLDDFVLTNHEYLVTRRYYDLPAGTNEYRLYSYLSTLFNNTTILDIGTLYGRSAVALSYNDKNQVISYNIEDQIRNAQHKIYTKKNIEFRIGNILDDLTTDLISKCKIVMIDIDHFEIIETKLIKKLEELGFSGIILLDDIHHPQENLNIAMQRLWNSIEHKKYDITRYGHVSGTGLIIMNSDIEVILE